MERETFQRNRSQQARDAHSEIQNKLYERGYHNDEQRTYRKDRRTEGT